MSALLLLVMDAYFQTCTTNLEQNRLCSRRYFLDSAKEKELSFAIVQDCESSCSTAKTKMELGQVLKKGKIVVLKYSVPLDYGFV